MEHRWLQKKKSNLGWNSALLSPKWKKKRFCLWIYFKYMQIFWNIYRAQQGTFMSLLLLGKTFNKSYKIRSYNISPVYTPHRIISTFLIGHKWFLQSLYKYRVGCIPDYLGCLALQYHHFQKSEAWLQFCPHNPKQIPHPESQPFTIAVHVNVFDGWSRWVAHPWQIFTLHLSHPLHDRPLWFDKAAMLPHLSPIPLLPACNVCSFQIVLPPPPTATHNPGTWPYKDSDSKNEKK